MLIRHRRTRAAGTASARCGAADLSNPGSSYPLRGNGKGGWLGWPTDPEMEAMRQQWFDAPDLRTQQAVCEQNQRRAFETVPFAPLGQVFQPTAFRKNVSGIVTCAIPLFGGVQKI